MNSPAGTRGLPLPLLLAVLFLQAPILASCAPEAFLIVEDDGEPAVDEFKDLFDAAKADPTNHELQARLGFHYYRIERDFNRGRVHYERAIELAGRRQYTGYHYLLGIIYWEMKEYDKALVELEDTYRVPQEEDRTFREDNYYRQSQWLAAKIYAEKKKDPEKALKYVGRFHEMGGSLDLQTEVYLAVTKAYIGKKDIQNATVNLDKFKELNGAKGDSWALERALNKLREEKQKEEEAAAAEKTDKKNQGERGKETPNSAKIGPKGGEK